MFSIVPAPDLARFLPFVSKHRYPQRSYSLEFMLGGEYLLWLSSPPPPFKMVLRLAQNLCPQRMDMEVVGRWYNDELAS